MWSLGCTVFEKLTRCLLFNPHEVAAKKYREFSRGKDRLKLTFASSVETDEAEEKAEQLARGAIVAGKYRLSRKLGTGRFSTVWMAERLTDVSLDAPGNILRDHAQGIAAQEPQKTERQLLDGEWQRAKGADDILDLALNYEHLLLVATLCGPIPLAMVQPAQYRASYFEEDGALRFRPGLRRGSLRNRLRCVPELKGQTSIWRRTFCNASLRSIPRSALPLAALLRMIGWQYPNEVARGERLQFCYDWALLQKGLCGKAEEARK